MKVLRRLPCHYCGNAGGTVDHKMPRCRGGKTVRDNCVPACRDCNEKKGGMDYQDFIRLIVTGRIEKWPVAHIKNSA